MPGSGASWLVGMLGLLVARLGLHVVLPELLGCSVGAGFDTSWRAGWSSFWCVVSAVLFEGECVGVTVDVLSVMLFINDAVVRGRV